AGRIETGTRAPARRAGAPLCVYGRSGHAAGRGTRRPRRISLRLYRLRASGCGPSRADHSAPAVVGGLVDRRRRPGFFGDSRLSDAQIMATCAPMRTGARRMTAMLKRVYHVLGQDGVSGGALLLVAGRTVGFVAAFAIPVVLARTFDQAAFGTYKQLFLIYATFYGLAQLGAAESLYYFVPRSADEAGRRIGNALVTLSLTGLACFAGLYFGRFAIAASLSNAALASDMPLLGLFLAFMLIGAAFEIVMVSRKEHTSGACVYAASDVVRTALFLVPAFVVGSLRSVLAGAVVFAGLRLAAMIAYFWREF